MGFAGRKQTSALLDASKLRVRQVVFKLYNYSANFKERKWFAHVHYSCRILGTKISWQASLPKKREAEMCGGRSAGPLARLLFLSTASLTTSRTAAWTCAAGTGFVAGGVARTLRPMHLASGARWGVAPGARAKQPGGLASPFWMGRASFPAGLTRLARAAATRTDYDAEQMRLLDSDECILVDEADNVVGHGSKKFCHLMDNISAGKALHRAFSVFLFNSEGKLLLQKRSDDKILFPNRWTNTCCSHPLYNPEEMDDPASPDARGVRSATVRKLEHELGIAIGSVPAESMHYMTRIVYKAAVGEDDKWGEHEVDYILLATADVKCDINPNEVSEIRYVGKDELGELLAQEERKEIMLSPWFKAVAQRWLPLWWDALLQGKLDSVKDTDTIHILS
jgi:isopentenyl-diphosphate delta-isomerase